MCCFIVAEIGKNAKVRLRSIFFSVKLLFNLLIPRTDSVIYELHLDVLFNAGYIGIR